MKTPASPATPSAITGPRFVWALGDYREAYPEMPDDLQDSAGTLILWDRQERKTVATLAAGYSQLICLELTRNPESMPFTTLEKWLNGLGSVALESEGIPGHLATPPTCTS